MQGDFDAGYMYKCSLMDLMPAPPRTQEQLKTENAESRELTELETVLPRILSMKPLQSSRIVDCNDSPLLSWRFTLSGLRVIMGFANGLLRVQLLENAFDLSQMGAFWTYAFADNDRGAINKAELTFDERYVITLAKCVFIIYHQCVI